MQLTIYLFIYLAGINLIALFLYWSDKQKARKNRYRIPERTLLLVAALGGGLGAFLGMKLFRHKTKHLQFQILVPLFLVIWAGVILWYTFH